MTYSELLKKYIKESRYTLDEISKLLSDKNLSASREHLSRLQNGKVPPASDEINKAIAEITGGDPDQLAWYAFIEKAPEGFKRIIYKLGEEIIPAGKRLLEEYPSYFEGKFSAEEMKEIEESKAYNEFKKVYSQSQLNRALDNLFPSVGPLITYKEKMDNSLAHNEVKTEINDSTIIPIGTSVRYGEEEYEFSEEKPFREVRLSLESNYPELASPQTEYVYIKEKKCIVPIIEAGKKGAPTEDVPMYLLFLNEAKSRLLSNKRMETETALIKSALMEAFLALETRVSEVLLKAMLKATGTEEEWALEYLKKLSLIEKLDEAYYRFLDFDIKDKPYFPDLVRFIKELRPMVIYNTTNDEITNETAITMVNAVEQVINDINEIAKEEGIK